MFTSCCIEVVGEMLYVCFAASMTDYLRKENLFHVPPDSEEDDPSANNNNGRMLRACAEKIKRFSVLHETSRLPLKDRLTYVFAILYRWNCRLEVRVRFKNGRCCTDSAYKGSGWRVANSLDWTMPWILAVSSSRRVSQESDY